MSDTELAKYSFLPWIRQGISSNITTLDNLELGGSGLTERAEISIRVTLNDSSIENRVQIIGPGDIVGLNANSIIRTEPKNWVTNFEPNYLPFIEFYDPDFLWRYTPASANADHRLRPWLTLIVLTENEFSRGGAIEVLPSITLADPDSAFPDPTQVWNWAHVHVNKDISDDGSHSVEDAVATLRTLAQDDPDVAYCRLVCPKKLSENTAYYAFVVPTFETGRLAGLGEDCSGIDALLPSWGSTHAARSGEYPIYYEWFFRTGSKGDFEYLVDLLTPKALGPEVGIRDMDVQTPGFKVSGITDPPVLGLEGALKSPAAVSTEWPPVDSSAPAFLSELEVAVNLQQDLQEGLVTADPVVTPPLYGRWHAIVDRLDITGDTWVHELNKDPRNRTPAGFGTSVIQKNQDAYMEEAWSQVGDINAVNQKLKQSQLALGVSRGLYGKNLAVLDVSRLVSITSPVHAKVLGSPVTLYSLMQSSVIPLAAVSPAFRKMIRPRGRLARRLDPEQSGALTNLLEQLNDGSISAATPRQTPDGVMTHDEVVAKVSERVTAGGFGPWLRFLLKQSWLIFILIVLFALVALVFGSPVIVLLAALAVAAGWLVWTGALQRRQDASDSLLESTASLAEDKQTVESVVNVPARPDFVVTVPGTPVSPDIARAGVAGSDSEEAANFRRALLDVYARFELEVPEPAAKEHFDLGNAAGKLLYALDPKIALTKRVLSFVRAYDFSGASADTIVPVMAYPEFPYPMYEPLSAISSELLIPNLNKIEQNSISLLVTNQRFIEAYMVGLNHEMSRELLWNEYPTDQRGSYFRQFWDVSDYLNTDDSLTEEELAEKLKDIPPLHTWGNSTQLGDHNNRSGDGDDSDLVLVIRGELLKRYPNAVIYAQKARWQTTESGAIDRTKKRLLDDEQPQKFPLYGAQISPDIALKGFDLTVEEARGEAEDDPGYYFVIQERPGEPRFGMDSADAAATSTASSWSDLTWGHVGAAGTDPGTINYIDVEAGIRASVDGDVQWGNTAADMAYILFQAPVMVAVHAEEMLPQD